MNCTIFSPFAYSVFPAAISLVLLFRALVLTMSFRLVGNDICDELKNINYYMNDVILDFRLNVTK